MALCIDRYTQEFPIFVLFLQFRCDDAFDCLLTLIIHPKPSKGMVFNLNNVGIIWIWIRRRTRLLLPLIVFLCSSIDTVSSKCLQFFTGRHCRYCRVGEKISATPKKSGQLSNLLKMTPLIIVANKKHECPPFTLELNARAKKTVFACHPGPSR